MVKSGDYQLLITGHGGWGNDPDVLRITMPTVAIPGYSNEEINRLSAEQLLATDMEQRAALIDELQSVIAEEVPMLPLYNTKGESVYRPPPSMMAGHTPLTIIKRHMQRYLS